jgi:hypothetical protein
MRRSSWEESNWDSRNKLRMTRIRHCCHYPHSLISNSVF